MKVIDEKTIAQKEMLSRILHRLQAFTAQIRHQETTIILADLGVRMDEPYMFVIVGEVKAGKSSFINALLGDPDLCAVAPSPMTDTIQQILYGETPAVEIISPHLKKVFQPNEVLRDIAIVDTPGTNTIIAHHQEITERFIPGSDLIVFVFEAKNPYRQSAWEFFDFIHEEWRKKVIFILQQKDLMDEADLQININGVVDLAKQKGIPKPVVFAVSAKQELEGRSEVSGFPVLTRYILEHVTGGKAQQQKIAGLIDTMLSIVDKLQKGLDVRQEQLNMDVQFRQEIKTTLADHGQRAKHQCDVLVENLMGAYDKVAKKYEDELSSALSFFPVLKRSIGSIFSKTQSLKSWFEDFTRRLQADFGTGLQDKINDRVLDLAESIQQMAHHIDLQIRNSKTVLANDHEIFAEIAQRRQNVLKELREAFEQFINRTENFTTKGVIDPEARIGTNVAAGSGVAVVGIILAAVTQGMVFDITGGVLTALGFLVAGITLGFQRGKVLRRYRAEMEKGQHRLHEELATALYTYVETLKQKMEDQFQRFDALLATEKNELETLVGDINSIRRDLGNLKKQVGQ